MSGATDADIAAGTREAIVATWSDNGIRTLFPSARDGQLTPSEGFFDALADAQTAAAQRGALIGVVRRRFAVEAVDMIWIDPLAGVPAAYLEDAEQSIAQACLVSRVELDLDTDLTTLELFG